MTIFSVVRELRLGSSPLELVLTFFSINMYNLKIVVGFVDWYLTGKEILHFLIDAWSTIIVYRFPARERVNSRDASWHTRRNVLGIRAWVMRLIFYFS